MRKNFKRVKFISIFVCSFYSQFLFADLQYEQDLNLEHSTTNITIENVVMNNFEDCVDADKNTCRVVCRNGWHQSRAYPVEHVTIDVYPNGYRSYSERHHFDGDGNEI